MARALDLSRQGLTSLTQIPRDIVRHVERDGEPYALSLAQNRLEELSNIHILRHVVQLDLSGNQLQCLDGINALTHLESLNAARNRLTSIDALASLARLRVLNIAENQLTEIDALKQLKSLVALDASYNSILKWPSLSQLTTLESVDMSSNQLEAFPVGVAARMFSPSLRRLSLVKNRIQQLCGIAALGMFLQNLETIKVDNNPATQRVLREGGCLDFLWVNLFANVTFTKGSGVRRDDFVVSQDIVEAVEDAVERSDEAVLSEFLLTGTAPIRAAPLTLYPSHSEPSAVTPCEDSPLIIRQSHAKLDQISRPLSSVPLVQPATIAAADGLSKESKMEMWKRMMEERKTQEQREKASAPIRDTVPVTPPPPPPAQISQPKKVGVSKPELMNRIAEGSSVSTSAVGRREAPAHTAAASTSSIDALTSHVKTLNDQLSGIRKYVNVWIKREQLTRIAAVKRIQRFTRRRQWIRHIAALVRRSRMKRQHEYGVEPCSSTRFRGGSASQIHLELYAIVIQRHVRGWLTRFRISRWMYYSDAAVRIQRAWRRHSVGRVEAKRAMGLDTKRCEKATTSLLVNAVATLAGDVRQLQRVFVLQEQVLARQWQELAHYKRFVEAAWAPAVVTLQSLWRGYATRRNLRVTSRLRLPQPIRSAKPKADLRDSEVAALRTELDALKQIVQRLVEKN